MKAEDVMKAIKFMSKSPFNLDEIAKSSKGITCLSKELNPDKKWYQFWKQKYIIIVKPL
jgi:hypothetical protein